jgi:hypothetical protein
VIGPSSFASSESEPPPIAAAKRVKGNAVAPGIRRARGTSLEAIFPVLSPGRAVNSARVWEPWHPIGLKAVSGTRHL